MNISLSISQPFEFSLLRILYLYCTAFLIGLFGLLDIYSFLSMLYILDINPPSGVESIKKTFSNSVAGCFVWVAHSFALQKLSRFMRSHLLIVYLSVWANGILFRKPFSVLMNSSFSICYLLDLYQLSQCSS